MKARFKLWWNDNHGTIYLFRYIIYSIVLLITVYLIDVKFNFVHNYLPKYFMMDADRSGSLLITLSGSLLTISTFTFSTILTVCTYFTSSFTASYIENFINNTFTMKLLGVYVGGFFYCVCALFLVRDQFLDHQVIAGSIGIIYSIYCMAQFVRFALGIISSVQSSKIIESLYQSAEKIIDEEIEKVREIEFERYEPFKYKYRVKSLATGYLNGIDGDGILNIIDKFNCKFVATAKIGQYLVDGYYIGEILSKEKIDKDTEYFDTIANCFIIQDNASSVSSYRASINKLVEISMNALSSGAKDPNTARHCITRISILLSKLARIKAHHTVLAQNDDAEVLYNGNSFRDDLHGSLYQIISSGKSDPSGAKTLIEGLKIIYTVAENEHKDFIKEYAEEIYRNCAKSLDSKFDIEMLENILNSY